MLLVLVSTQVSELVLSKLDPFWRTLILILVCTPTTFFGAFVVLGGISLVTRPSHATAETWVSGVLYEVVDNELRFAVPTKCNFLNVTLRFTENPDRTEFDLYCDTDNIASGMESYRNTGFIPTRLNQRPGFAVVLQFTETASGPEFLPVGLENVKRGVVVNTHVDRRCPSPTFGARIIDGETTVVAACLEPLELKSQNNLTVSLALNDTEVLNPGMFSAIVMKFTDTP